MFLFSFLIHFSFSDNSVCALFSYDADTCLSIFGCGYCLTTNKCLPNHPADGVVDSCVGSGQYIQFAHSDLGQCFYLLSDDPCSTCASTTNLGSTCGWCESLGTCIAGDSAGAYAGNCPAEDWKFSKRMCSKSRCAYAKDIDHCKAPCRWNQQRQVCHIYRNLSVMSEDELYNQKQTQISLSLNKTLLFVFIASAVGFIIASIWRSKRPLYAEFEHMDSVSLDDLPPVMNETR